MSCLMPLRAATTTSVSAHAVSSCWARDVWLGAVLGRWCVACVFGNGDTGWLKTVDQYYLGANNSIAHAGVQVRQKTPVGDVVGAAAPAYHAGVTVF